MGSVLKSNAASDPSLEIIKKADERIGNERRARQPFKMTDMFSGEDILLKHRPVGTPDFASYAAAQKQSYPIFWAPMKDMVKKESRKAMKKRRKKKKKNAMRMLQHDMSDARYRVALPLVTDPSLYSTSSMEPAPVKPLLQRRYEHNNKGESAPF